jgi:hypothetical protein
MKSLHRYIPTASLPDTYGGSFPKPSLSSYEWDVVLRSGDEEYASKWIILVSGGNRAVGEVLSNSEFLTIFFCL